jgi:hypothetical protein
VLHERGGGVAELKFFLDENISHKLFLLLKKNNYDVVSVQSLCLQGIKNGDLFVKAFQTQRILVTFDRDFFNFADRPHFGILILDIHPARDIFVLPVFKKFLTSRQVQQLKWVGHIVILKVDRVEIILFYCYFIFCETPKNREEGSQL